MGQFAAHAAAPPICLDGVVARFRKLRPGPVGLGFALWDLWRRLTPRQRKQLLELVREHGPRAAKLLVEMRRRRRARW
jgi:hypothetical protein